MHSILGDARVANTTRSIGSHGRTRSPIPRLSSNANVVALRADSVACTAPSTPFATINFSMRIDSGRAEGEAAKQAVQEATDRDRSEKGFRMNSELKKCDCGKVWKPTGHKMPYGNRDSDSARCSCGMEIKTWSGSHTF